MDSGVGSESKESSGLVRESSFASSLSPVVDETSIEDKAPKICGVCEKQFEFSDMYRCLSCCKSETDVNENSSMAAEDSNDMFCEFCIVGLHLRKKHEIIDYKGYQPAVCATHETLSRLFCKDCQVVFCSACIMNHSSHVFVNISEKSAETRKQVFHHLGDLETLLKPLKHQQDVTKRSFDEIKTFSDSFTSEKVTESLLTVCDRVIKDNASQWESLVSQPESLAKLEVSTKSSRDLETSRRLTENNENYTVRLRKLLQMSDGLSIEEFLALEKTVEKSVSDQNARVANHFYLGWSLDLEQVLRSSIKDVLKIIRTASIANVKFTDVDMKPVEVQKSNESLYWPPKNYVKPEAPPMVASDVCKLFNVVVNDKVVTFSVLSQMPEKKYFIKRYQCHHDDCSFVNILLWKHFVCFCDKQGRVDIFCLRSACFINCDMGLENCLQPLAFSRSSKGNWVFTVWNNGLSRIELVNNDSGHKICSMRCKEKPKIWETHGNVWVTVDSNDNLVYYNVVSDTRVTISNLHHGLSQIDGVSLEREVAVKLFDYKLGVSVEAQFNLDSSPVSFSVIKASRFKPVMAACEVMDSQNGCYYIVCNDVLYVGGTKEVPKKELIRIELADPSAISERKSSLSDSVERPSRWTCSYCCVINSASERRCRHCKRKK